jgi:hypothetical protein
MLIAGNFTARHAMFHSGESDWSIRSDGRMAKAAGVV